MKLRRAATQEAADGPRGRIEVREPVQRNGDLAADGRDAGACRRELRGSGSTIQHSCTPLCRWSWGFQGEILCCRERLCCREPLCCRERWPGTDAVKGNQAGSEGPLPGDQMPAAATPVGGMSSARPERPLSPLGTSPGELDWFYPPPTRRALGALEGAPGQGRSGRQHGLRFSGVGSPVSQLAAARFWPV